MGTVTGNSFPLHRTAEESGAGGMSEAHPTHASGTPVRVCPRTGRALGPGESAGPYRRLAPLIGLAALIWILVRVIPKPRRLSYPCVRAAAPLASGFLAYLALPALSTVPFLRWKKPLRPLWALAFASVVLLGIAGFHLTSRQEFRLTRNAEVVPNQPLGVGRGIFPGRVVWVHNPNATNTSCDPSAVGHGWFMPENNDQAAVDNMVSAAIRGLTGQTSDAAAWEAIFKYHNATRGKGAVPYAPGEKIFIKTNATSAWSGNFRTSDLSKQTNQYHGVSETSPAIILAVLRQLVNVVGVAQGDIYVGDPMKHIYKHVYDQLHPEFPAIHYLDNSYSTLGRERAVAGNTPRIFYADHGTILRDQVWDTYRLGTTPWYHDCVYTVFDSTEYMINIPMLKGHKRAGMTMFAKNHFGSHTAGDASHLHNGLVAPREMEVEIARPGYGLYRVQVDLMSSTVLGKKNLFYLLDALWATDYELDAPLKWQMAPFNNHWMSSVFASLDNVAIESVGYDFLRSEYTIARGAGTYVQMDGVDDYLHQAADSTNWPAGIRYDPDSSGVHIYSLGVHEHWNNATDRRYSRDLGAGSGIELVPIEQTDPVGVGEQESALPRYLELYRNAPNPFNGSTTIRYSLPGSALVEVAIFDARGRAIRTMTCRSQGAGYRQVAWDGTNAAGRPVSSGVYVYRVRASSLEDGTRFERSSQMVVLR